MDVQVVIKSPTQHVDDFKIDCDLSWTVGQVKDQIGTLYPSKPKREQQKLIYSGKLLPDHLLLKEVLSKTQEIHTMHLVCPLPPAPAVFETPDAQNEVKEANNFAQEPFSTAPTNPFYPEMNQRLTPQDVTSMPSFPGYANGIPVNVAYPTGGTMYQYMAMQQMYTQFMRQYLSQANGGTSPGVPYGFALPQAPVTYQAQTVPEPLANQNPVVPNVPDEQRPPINRDEMERDYIDYLYLMSRAIMLFAILYYYSSFTRILTVLLLGVFISLYVRVSRQYQRQVDELRQQRHNNAAPETTNDNTADIQLSGNAEQNSEEATTEATTDAPTDERAIRQEAQPYVSMLSIILTFFSSLLTSLIPSEPAPININ